MKATLQISAFGLGFATLVSSRSAGAEPSEYLNLGLVLSLSVQGPGDKIAVGVGPSASLVRFTEPKVEATHYGVSSSVLYYPERRETAITLSPEIGTALVGFEVGPRLAFSGGSPDLRLAVTPYLTAGYAWIGARISLPAPRGVEVESLLVPSAPIRLQGKEPCVILCNGIF